MEWLPGLIAGTAAVLVAAVSGYFQNAHAKAQRAIANSTPSPPSTQQVWDRLADYEASFRAALEILEELAEQWPGDTPPNLPKKALKVLSEKGYLPSEWESYLE